MINFETPQEALVHFGVAGMKWGKARAKGNSKSIVSARRSLENQVSNMRKAEDKTYATKDPVQKAKAKKQEDALAEKFKKNPDRVIAVRLTRGEKIVSTLLTGPFGLAAIAATSVASRRIEQKQEKGKYNK